MGKIKVVLLCHFSSAQVREKLNLHESRWYKYSDFAKWNINIIEGFRDRDDIDLHVIAPHNGLKRSTQVFEYDGVSYYFFRMNLPFPFDYVERFILPQSKRAYPRNRKYVNQFISSIIPDIVILVGAENPYYSITALDVEGTPIIIHLQTVYANPDRIKNAGNVDPLRWNVELELFRKTPYMACTGRMYYDLVKKYNPEAILFPRRWPEKPYPEIPDMKKKYDFVFFARYLSKNKGFDNAIEAMVRFVGSHPNVKCLAVGEHDNDWPVFDKRLKETGLCKNLEVHPPFKEYTDLLKYVKQARFALLPITMDVLSGTILEAMSMGMPVLTCRTSGTPSLNEKRNTVLISDIGDDEGLYNNMLRLYDNKGLQETLKNNGYLFLKEYDAKNANNIDIMVAQIKAVIAHYNYGTPIPKELLYNIDENKDYRK